MRTSSKSVSLCLAFALVLVFGSMASAGWSYSQVTVTTPYSTVVQYQTPTGYYTYSPTIYSYPPVVTVPTLVAPRVIYRTPVIVPRVYVRPRPFYPVRSLLW